MVLSKPECMNLPIRYPFAVVGINMTGMVYSWLQRSTLNPYLYTACTQWPATLEEFFEIYCTLLIPSS